MRGYNIHTTYQARQLKWLTQGNSQWLLSLDSGFLNEVPEYSYRDWERGKTLLESGGELWSPFSSSRALLHVTFFYYRLMALPIKLVYFK